ncbi:endo alpha-1,4 polygalactosaminidase [Nitrosomonas communis]|uniref:endo alpha-1,4 polygalactosaminidase n=1 Tax=Nitrosomonas communis TaxID=44574 RepID=UPI001BA4DCDB|nr:endo alpha-1,4 polygalactosaminidase [Nitrosomonas communis]
MESSLALAEPPKPPLIVLSQDHTKISITWSPVLNASSYQLFYAPFPFTGPESIRNVDMGNATSGSIELWDGAAFIVAVKALNDAGSSDYSNIELFILSKAPLLDPEASPVTGNWYKPPVAITWQWQLKRAIENGGINEIDEINEINTSYPVQLYDIDLFNSSPSLINTLKASGKKVICYFSAGTYENYREDKDKFKPEELGNTLIDWPEERWLDIRSQNVAEIMISRLNLALLKGCDGVEPDNVNVYTNNSGFDLSARDQLAFNKFIANEAHKRGLSVALKNNMEQIPELIDFFDFSINERCHELNECDSLTHFIINGKPVLNAEYLQSYIDNPAARQALCDTSKGAQFSTLILSRDLDDSQRFSCF